jgi:hypothetical protein
VLRSALVLHHWKQLLKLCTMVKTRGCYSEAEKEEAAELATEVLLSYLEAGFLKKQLSNYYLLLSFMGEWQPPKNVNYLITGQFLNCPSNWDPWDRPATCLKDVSDENIELHHRIMKSMNTNQGGGKWQQSEETLASDTVKRDENGILQLTERYSVKLVESIEQKVP